MQPGRSCPLAYRYAPSVFARAAEIHADTLYVIGGLYGNPCALDSVLELAAHEPAPPTLVFNGDFNWFNIDDAAFCAINHEVLRHHATRGNVETEIASDSPDAAAGCGCAYPDNVSDEDVARSNAISLTLRETARRHPQLCEQLNALPMHTVAQIGNARVAIVHGDLESLSGWSLTAPHLAMGENQNIIKNQILTTNCHIVASSHTCAPLARTLDVARQRCAIINNGAAGMPNFRDTRFGVITRMSVRACTQITPLTTLRVAGVYAEALPVHYDHARWLEQFRAQWPAGSPAHVSYYRRMTEGTACTVADAYAPHAIEHP